MQLKMSMHRSSQLFRTEAVETQTATFDIDSLESMYSSLWWEHRSSLHKLLNGRNVTEDFVLIHAFIFTVADMSTNVLFTCLVIQYPL